MIVSQHFTLNLRTLRIVIVLILVVTAIPAAFGPPLMQWWRWNIVDSLANILLYLPVGLSLAGQASALRAGLIAGGASMTIEVAQMFSTNRIAHPFDVVCNILGTLIGHAAGRRFRIPYTIRVTRTFGVTALIASGLWILSSRTFRMYVGGFGWFASERKHPQFWSMLPADVIRAGVELHSLGVLANTAIGGLLAGVGIAAVVRARNPALRMFLAGVAGYCVGNMMTPNLNVYPVWPVVMGTGAALALAACLVTKKPDDNTVE